MASPKDQQGDRKIAVALAYRRETDAAPRVVAKGDGHVAEAILAIARDRGIAVRSDAPLATILAQVELDREIPVEAYVAVAEILSYLYRTDRDQGGSR